MTMDPAQALEVAEIARNSSINEMIARADSPVQRFYAGAVVLVTGGSGFLGKQLIEKLFRSCNIRKIYIFLRQKKNKSLEERLECLIQDQLYEYLHKTQPDFASRLIPVEADITQIEMGLTPENWKILTEEVNVIFHVAASINFVEPLKSATLINVRGTRELLELAHRCKSLKSFVHVSTAYVHATPERVGQQVLEQFYDSPFSPDFLIELVEQLDETTLKAITPQLIGSWPNTYAFTKALSEEVVRIFSENLPACVVRPAIVLPAAREPPGWVDKSTMNGPVGFIIGACLGGLHVMYGKCDEVLDIVPVDFVNNASILAARETFERNACGNNDIKIYTVTSNRIPIYIGTLHSFLETVARQFITPKLIWYGYVVLTGSKFIFTLLAWLLHLIPGYVIDFVLKITGYEPKVIRLFNKAFKHNQVYGLYSNNSWKFGDSNLIGMFESQTPEDRMIYHCDSSSLDIERYLCICCIGTRKYILNDGLKNTEYAVKKQFWLRILNAIFLSIYSYILWKITVFIFASVYFILKFIFCS